MKLIAGTSTNFRAVVRDTHGAEDTGYDFTFTSRDTSLLVAEKTGANTVTLTAPAGAQGSVWLDMVYGNGQSYQEIIEIDDRTVGGVTLEPMT